jgi:site-specific recombinase
VASAQAYAVISQQVSAQAFTLAYVDIIAVGTVALFCLAPMAFLMQRPRKGARAAAAH